MTAPSSNAIRGLPRWTTGAIWHPLYGSYNAAYPCGNLAVEPLARVCRSAGVAPSSTRYLAQFAQPCAVQLVSLVRHTISLAGQYRCRLWSGAGVPVTANPATGQLAGVHRRQTGDAVVVWAAAGSLPAGLSDGSVYTVRVVTPWALTLHVSPADAVAGVNPVALGTAGSGTLYLLGALLQDTGWASAWPPAFDVGALAWEDPRWWSGQYSSDDIAGYIWTYPILFAAPWLAQSVTVEVSDPTNAAGFVDIGMIDLASAWQLTVNYSYKGAIGFRFRTRSSEQEGGVLEFDRRAAPRTFSGQVEAAPATDACQLTFQDLRQNDIDTPAMWIQAPNDPRQWLRTSFLARNVSPGPISAVTDNQFNFVINIEEVI
jgi:hypothetical protein